MVHVRSCGDGEPVEGTHGVENNTRPIPMAIDALYGFDV